MQTYGRLIGIDVGTRRVGIARTDLLRTVPNPVGTFPPEKAVGELERQLQEGQVLGFVIGWPLSLEGEETEATQMVREFANRLRNRFPGVELYRSDERYTSRQAMEGMIRTGVPRGKRREKGRVDKIAAALILQSFLEQYPQEEQWRNARL